MIQIGFTFTNASSTLGSVSGSTNALDRNVSGKMNMKPAFITALGERSSRPSVVNTQLTPNANTTVSAERREHAEHAAARDGTRGSAPSAMITVPAIR